MGVGARCHARRSEGDGWRGGVPGGGTESDGLWGCDDAEVGRHAAVPLRRCGMRAVIDGAVPWLLIVLGFVTLAVCQ